MVAVALLFPREETQALQKDLNRAGWVADAKAFLRNAMILSAFAAFAFFFIAKTVLQDEVLSLSLALLFFAGSLFSIKRLPGIMKKKRAREIEAELPFVLRFLGVELELNVPFEEALGRVSSDYKLSLLLGSCLKESREGGASLPEALRGLGESIDSIHLKRAVAALVSAYQHGGKGNSLKRLAEELIDVQKSQAREYAAKSSFTGLLFISFACIIPALFQAYSLVGSSIFAVPFSASDIWLAYLVVFPILNVALIAFTRFSMPEFLQTSKKHALFSAREIAILQSVAGFQVKRTLSFLLAAGVALFFVFVFFSIRYSLPSHYALFPLALPAFAYFYLSFRAEQKMKEVERFLPDALFQTASFPKGVSIEKLFASLASSGYGELSREFRMALNQVRSGASVESALKDLSERNNSLLLSRAASLLAQGYSTGASMEKALKETADDIFALSSLERERASLLSMQKYTLLLGGGILVPLILGLLASTISDLNLSSSFLSSLSVEEKTALFNTSIEATRAYLLVYAFLASSFIGIQEGLPRKAFIYFLLLAPLSLAVFHASTTVSLY